MIIKDETALEVRKTIIQMNELVDAIVAIDEHLHSDKSTIRVKVDFDGTRDARSVGFALTKKDLIAMMSAESKRAKKRTAKALTAAQEELAGW